MSLYHTIVIIQSFKGVDYKIFILKPKDITLTVYLAEYLFLHKMKDKKYLRIFQYKNGKISKYETEKLLKCDVVRIERVSDDTENIFEV